MFLSLMLFVMGLMGFMFNRKNMMLLFMSMEMMLLGLTLNMLNTAFNLEDMNGLMFSVMMMMMAGAESAMGLSMLVSYYRLRGNMNMENTYN
uniref:NADH-ubiquinone oxidoreductase chain 4L n=2 Tax=Magnusiomyces TaxID=1095182 RepID=A0A8E5J653_9ASCO|nr:NADH dehydrogenase subunit 4L [Magnusiomyces ingens]YP_010180080.1 NADH dehydrogenase subunit 4L [Saprochaete ingens]AHY04914.1 NADH dehydrogenase subunit 4L [Magnusiomyces ingens]QUX32924.1 NADH dehydrogenase subunit 4L [Magnusiomyces ingens]QUX32948.1 NADH dehydrogenase subunit 4L [Saprochaete ingens]